jgi:carboxypeptidase C (cathepsin A)
VPSASPDPIPNAETWLDFTDLVFIDPASTGYSRVLNSNEDARRKLYSVDGDIAYLAETIRRWLDKSDRIVSPKYILGESYGGFRGPRLVRELAINQGVGISGLVLVSPALDFGGRSFVFDPFAFVTTLPSMTAAARAAHGPITRAQLADVEHYAATDYLVDLTRGEHDPDAIARRSARVAEFTGLDPALVQRYHGAINNTVFLHELDRAQGRVGSVYDATITSSDAFPLETLSSMPDAVLESLKAPVSSAMVAIYGTRLNWRPDSPYQLYGAAANREWDYGRGFGARPQAVGFMRVALALDPHFSVLIAHGMFDLITPYFGTQLQLDQIPASDGADRVRLVVYPGGHMFYTNDASRAAFREASRAMFEQH